jgi:hypothetical protein
MRLRYILYRKTDDGGLKQRGIIDKNCSPFFLPTHTSNFPDTQDETVNKAGILLQFQQ